MDFNITLQGLDPEKEKEAAKFSPPAAITRSSVLDFNKPLVGLETDTTVPEIVAEDALKTNPQQFKQQKDLARKTGLPVDVVAADDGSLSNSVRAKEIIEKLGKAPAALKWFGVPENAKAAHQDVDYLANAGELAVGLYQAQGAVVDWTGNIARGAGESFLNRIIGSTTRSVATVADSLADYLETNVLDLGRIEYNFTGSGPMLRWRASTPEDIAKESPLLAYARDFEKVKLGYKATTTWEDFKDNPAVNFIPFALETGLVSLPDMVAALANLPAYVMSLTGDIGQKRAQNDGRVDATVGDLLNAMPYSISSSLLEKIGAKGILGIGINDKLKGAGKKAIAVAVGKGAVKEGITEGIQEPVQYAGETLDTIKGFKIDEAIQRSLQGIVVGTGFGGSIRTGTAIAESQTKARQSRERAEGFRKLNNIENDLRNTDPEAWADFQSSIMEDSGVDGVRLSEEGVDLLMQDLAALPEQLKLDLTSSLIEQVDASAGASLSPKQFWNLPKDTIDKLAEHVAFDVNQMSAVEAEEMSSLTELMSSKGFTAEVEAELASVETNTDLFVEIEQSIMQTGGALTADPAAARAAAQQMAAVFTTMAKRTGVPLQKIKDRFLPRIEGVTGQPAADALEQDVFHGTPYRFAPEPGFPHGRPRIDKMGTGEGAQMYGRGFYSAEAESLGLQYRDAVSGDRRVYELDGQQMPISVDPEKLAQDFNVTEGEASELAEIIDTLRNQPVGADLSLDGVIKKLTSELDSLSESTDEVSALLKGSYERSLALANKYKDRIKVSAGTLYKLDLPDADAANLLDYDAPISSQPKVVQDAITELGFMPDNPDKMAGGDIWYRMRQQLGEQAAVDAMRAAGVPGLRYKDARSRGKDDGTRNFVVWDQDVLDRMAILERNGEALDAISEASLEQGGGFEAYRKIVDPEGRTIPAEDRPNLRMGDMYGMLPKDAEVVGELDDVILHRGANGDYYATAYNADLGEQDVVGYIQGRENGTELAVVEEMQGKGIGSELQYLFRRENPLAPTGGLTEAGASRLESTYDRLAAEYMDPLDGLLFQDAPDGALEQARATVQDPEALGLTADEAARINPIYRPEAMPTNRLGTNEKAAKWLEDQFDGDAIIDFTEVLSEEQINQLGRLTAAEAQLALESTGNAADWYSEAVLRAMDVASIKYPMLQDDAAAAEAGFGTASNARFAFTYIMAVTSQNLDVAANSVAADTAFSEMVESIKSGDYSMKKEWGTGDKQAAMGKNFEKFLPMLNAMNGGTPQEQLTNLDKMFREKRTVREWEVAMKAAGIPYSPPGNTAKDAVVYGSSTLGPKIGNGFWQNLNGNFDPLTIDLWMRRTWGRLTGKSIGQPDAVPAQRRRLKAAISKSRSNEQGSPDLIEMARSDLASSEAALEAHKSAGQLEGQTKKDFSAETRRLNKEVSEGKALLSDLAGLKAPEPWKAEYGKTDDSLLAYSNRLITAWSKEYKRLQETYGSANIPTELQPTWARAAKAIKSNLSTPLDQIANGTQRKQVEAVGQRAREILSERGIDVTTADLQALLWYPEKELWGGLRDKLEVDEDGIPVVTANSLNESYDTTFARIFRSQGYEVEGIEGDGAGGSGQGAVSGQDAGSVGPEGTAGTRQAAADIGRELFQEVDFVGDVIFEVAPDPNNVELSARWNALPPAAQLAISDTVSKSVLPSVLEAAEAEGSVSPQIGSYLEDTNPSFSLRLTSGDPAAVANAVGFVLSQDSMVALSADAFEGSFEAGAVRIQVGDKSLQEIDAIYQTLRGIEGFPQIGGQSTTDGQMTLILEEGVDVEAFSDAVVSALPSEYSDAVFFNDVNVAFPEKKDYDYGSSENDPAGNAGVARQRYRAVRVQASQELAAAIDRYERGGQQPAADQQLDSGARGSIEGARPTDVQDIVIRLYEAENLSTFLHESGHLYLKMLGTLASDATAPQQVKDDFAGVLKFLGVKSEGEIGTAQHEKWAETYEQYLRDGKAPSQELRSAFAKFSAWLTTLYSSIKSIGTGRAALNKDITGVMDRLLATDEQIANVQSEMRMAPMFKDAEAAGMTDEAFAEYKQRYEDARDAAREELVQEAFAETRRERTKWWREELKTETNRVLEGMDTDPAWRTRAIIQAGVLPSGAPLPEVYPPRMKLNKAATAEYGHDLPGGNQLFARDGVSPDRAAQDLGYETGDQMLYELSQLPKDENGRFLTAKQFADQQAQEYMLQEHGDIMNPDEMHEEALMKVHSRRQAQVILDELRLLNRKAGGRDSVTNAAARNAAEQAMSEKTISEIESPTKYLNAERRFSMKAAEAVIAGDIDAALRFKTQQLLNFHMYRTARDMRMKADKMIATLSKRSRQKMDPKRVEPSFITQITAMVSGIDFSSRMSENRQATLSAETLQSWADQQSL